MKKKKKTSGILPKIVLAVVAIYAIVMIFTLRGRIDRAQEKNADLQQELQEQTQVNEGLQQDLEKADDPESIAETAREEFGLVDSDETVYYDIGA